VRQSAFPVPAALVALALCGLLGACTTLSPPDTAHTAPRSTAAQQEAPLRFVLAVHAATEPGDALNPPLSTAGRTQAEALAAKLAKAPLVAVYANEFLRTQQTAQAALEQHPGLALQAFFSRGPLEETARDWRQRYHHGMVLAVGDPAQITLLARALCACPVATLEEGESGHVLEVRFDAQGRATLQDPWIGEPHQ